MRPFRYSLKLKESQLTVILLPLLFYRGIGGKTPDLEFEGGDAFYIVSAGWVLNCSKSKISTSVDVSAFPFPEFVVSNHKIFLSFL